MDRRTREREGLQDGRETCCDVWFRGVATDKKTGGRAGGDRVEDAQISVGSDQ